MISNLNLNKFNKKFFVNIFYIRLRLYSTFIAYNLINIDCNIVNNFKKNIEYVNTIFIKNSLMKKFFLNTKNFKKIFFNFLLYSFFFDLLDSIILIRDFFLEDRFDLKFAFYHNRYIDNLCLRNISLLPNRNILFYRFILVLKFFFFKFYILLKKILSHE